MSWNDNKFLAFDFETSGEMGEFALQPWRVKTKQAWATSLVWAYGDPEMPVVEGGLNPTADDMRAMLQHAIDNDMTLVGWNTTFDIGWLIAYGLEDLVMRCKFIDGMLLWKHATQSPEYSLKKSYSLKAAVRELLPEHANYEADIDFHDESPEARRKLHHYNQLDTMFTLQITKHWYNQLTPKQLNAALIEAECLPMIASANVRGLIVDLDKANALVAHLENVANDRLAQLSEHGVTEEIVRSPKQLAELLYKTWGLQCEYFTNSGSESTDKEALHELSLIDPRAKLIREYREALNNKTKFAETLIESAQYNEDGTTHPEARVFGTYSGRLTYSSNQGSGKAQRQTGFALHQMKRGKEYRELIKAPEGFTLVEFDAAGQEFRWMALASNDETMQQLCQPGGDAHAYMGNKINPDASDKKAARQLGKVANLSLQYRTSAKKLKTVARVQYGMPMELPEAVKIHSTYQEAYKGVPQYWEKQISDAKKNKYAETFAGRRVSIDGDWNKNGWAMGSTAINYRIQGTGADQKYLAMKILKPYLLEIGGQFAWDLHDGIYLFIPSNIVDVAVRSIKQLLDELPYQQAWGFSSPIPLPWDCKTGSSWGDLKEYNLDAGAGPGDQSQPLNREALPQGGDQSWGTNNGLVETVTSKSHPVQVDATVVEVDFIKKSRERALEKALDLAASGIKVFPCKSNKEPVNGFSDWENAASSDSETIRWWFNEKYRSSATMVGMPTGANNLLVLDPDVPKPEKGKYTDGLALFNDMVVELGLDLSNVPVVISPSGGKHFIFSQPLDGSRYGCSPGNLPKAIDVKGDGGYVIAIGSERDDGLRYEADPQHPPFLPLFKQGALPQLPEGIAELLHPRKRTDSNSDNTKTVERMSRQMLASALRAIPNNAHFDSREDWVHMGHAIYGASDGDDWGRDLWIEWSSKWKGTKKVGSAEKFWDTVRPASVTSGAGYIRQQLDRLGEDELLTQAHFDKVQIELDDGENPPQGVQKPAASQFKMGRFVREDPRNLARREFLYGTHYIRKFVSATVAPGAMGKSSLIMVEAVSMAIGRGLLDATVKEPLRVYYWNGEDPMDEIKRRFYAIFLHYKLSDDDYAKLEENLFLDSGRENKLKVAAQDRNGISIAKPLVEALTKETIENKIDVIVVDPFIACHSVSENDNPAIEAVASVWREIADKCAVSVELVHHVRKTNGNEVTVEDSRGAAALHAACRSMRALNKMTDADALRAGIEHRWQYFREGSPDSDKSNMGPPETAKWRRMVGERLPNGDFDNVGDNVGVATVWIWEALADITITPNQRREILNELRNNEHAARIASNDWAGHVFANTLNLDSSLTMQRARIGNIIRDWERDNIIQKVEVRVAGRNRDRTIWRPVE